MNTSENLIEKFRSKSFKITPQRLGIFKILEGNLNHPSAEDIFDKIKKTYPTISFTTVYKTLDILEKMGEVLKITIDDERKHYDPNTDTHHHIICLGCNKISDVDGDSVSPELPERNIERVYPFQIPRLFLRYLQRLFKQTIVYSAFHHSCFVLKYTYRF